MGNIWKSACMFCCYLLFWNPKTVASKAPLPGIFQAGTPGCRFLLQGIFPTRGSNPYLLHWQVDSLPLSHQGKPSCMHINLCMWTPVCCQSLTYQTNIEFHFVLSWENSCYWWKHPAFLSLKAKKNGRIMLATYHLCCFHFVSSSIVSTHIDHVVCESFIELVYHTTSSDL